MTRGRKLYTSPEQKAAYWKRKADWFKRRDRMRAIRKERRRRHGLKSDA